MEEIRQKEQKLYLGKPKIELFTWSRIGDIDGNDLYLCDTTVCYSTFGESNDYMSSIVRKKCLEFYKEFLTNEERNHLINHPDICDPVFLLSEDECTSCRSKIDSMKPLNWLRSPGHHDSHVAFACPGGEVFHINLRDTKTFIRPAIILKKG